MEDWEPVSGSLFFALSSGAVATAAATAALTATAALAMTVTAAAATFAMAFTVAVAAATAFAFAVTVAAAAAFAFAVTAAAATAFTVSVTAAAAAAFAVSAVSAATAAFAAAAVLMTVLMTALRRRGREIALERMRERRFDRFVRIAAHAGDEENARAGELADGPFADAAADDAVDLIVNEGTDLGAVTGARRFDEEGVDDALFFNVVDLEGRGHAEVLIDVFVLDGDCDSHDFVS